MAQDPLNSPLEVNIKQEFQCVGNQKYSGNFKEAHEGILKEETLFDYAPDSPKLIKNEVEEDGFVIDKIKTEITQDEESLEKCITDSHVYLENWDSVKEPKEEICSESFLDYSSIKQEELIIKDDVDQNRKRFNVTAIECDRKLTSFHRTNTSEAVMYKCDQCDYQSRLKSSLTNHIIIHKKTGEAITYKCDQCNFQTVRKHSLKEHSLIHRKPEEAILYKCSQCDYETIWKHYLTKHYRIHKKTEGAVVPESQN